MAFTDKTWAFQEALTSANFNLVIRDNFRLVPHRIPKTADQSVTSSTVLIDDTHLQFAIAANEAWEFQLVLSFTGPGFLKVALNAPSGSAGWWAVDLNIAGTVNRSTVPTATFTDSTTLAGTGQPDVTPITGYVLNGSTAGTFKLRWAQSSSSGTATIVKQGSWLQRRKV